MIATNDAGYFFDNSLFFPDRESVLVFGGVDPHEEYGRPGNTGKDIYRFKPDQNIWEFVGEIPRARHHHSVAYLRGRIYIVGESNGWRNRGVCKKKERKKKAKQQGFSFHLRIAFKLKKKKRLLPYIIFFTALFSKPRKKICRSSYCAIFFVKERFKDLCWQKERERERGSKKRREKHFSPGGADPLEDKLHRKSFAVGSVWSYDPTTRTWFNEPGMLTARKDFGLVVSHGKMYAIGGQGRNGMWVVIQSIITLLLPRFFLTAYFCATWR